MVSRVFSALPEELGKEFKQFCKIRGIFIKDVIRALIEEFLEDQELQRRILERVIEDRKEEILRSSEHRLFLLFV